MRFTSYQVALIARVIDVSLWDFSEHVNVQNLKIGTMVWSVTIYAIVIVVPLMF